MFKCEICSREFKTVRSLSGHIKKHNLTIKEYYDDYLKKSINDGLCQKCLKETKFLGYHGYRKYCGYKCAQNDIEVKSKIKNSNLKKYGFKSAFQSEQVKTKYKKIMLDRYGVEWPMQLEENVQNKIKTNLKKYGAEVPYQNSEVREKGRQTCLKNHGVDNYSKTFEFRLHAREMLIGRIKKQCGSKIRPMRGANEKSCFDELEKYIPYKIKRDVSKIGYFPDGFIRECNLVIEFDEPEHQQRLWYQKHDKKRDEDFKKIGYETFRIKQIEWENIELKYCIIEKLKRIIDDRVKQGSGIML